MTTVMAIFTALANIKAIAGYLEQFAGAVTIWYIQQQSKKTQMKIVDAVVLEVRAKTDEDRFKAAEAWQIALSRPRINK